VLLKWAKLSVKHCNQWGTQQNVKLEDDILAYREVKWIRYRTYVV
tara:strand:- start:1822 stop:1956 length:135 start_codon:yes stop_codon:yes gene_type:complete